MKLPAIGGPWDGERCDIGDDWREWDIPRLTVTDDEPDTSLSGTGVVYGSYWFARRDTRTLIPIHRVSWPDEPEKREKPNCLVWQESPLLARKRQGGKRGD
jgi:hypothetical protein